MKIILASQSVGRKDLLSYLNIPFDVVPSGLDEDKITGKTPLETLQLRARLKGEEVLNRMMNYELRIRKNPQPTTHPASTGHRLSGVPSQGGRSSPWLDNNPQLIISADSGAILDKQLIGKPKDYKNAIRILQALSGRKHEFITAIYIIQILKFHSEDSQIPFLRSGLNLTISDQKKTFHFASDKRSLKSSGASDKTGIENPSENKDHRFDAVSEKFSIEDLLFDIWQTFDRSYVTFRKLSDEDIELYLKNTDYTRFAGGYAISSSQNFISKIEGSVSNVIGLPLEKVIPILKTVKALD